MRRLLFISLTIILLAGAALSQTSSTPAMGPIVLVMLENQGYSDVVGSPYMPYLNGLISQGGLATNYYADSHGSLSEYFMLTTGQTITVDNAFTCQVTVDNFVREMAAINKGWMAYAESLPSAGYLGGDVYPYVKHHNPWVYFIDVINNPNEAAHVVPFTQFASDMGAGALPAFSMVIPNDEDNGHDCPDGSNTCANSVKLQQTDTWLQTNIAPLFSSAQFQKNGLLVVAYDEGNLSDNTYGGGHTAVVFAGPWAKQAYQSGTFYRHENLLRTFAESLGFQAYPGAAIYVSNMSEFFNAAPTSPPPPPGTPGTITGSVTSISDGHALSGATVSFSGGATTTNSSGAYSFTNVTPGTYNVTASTTGFFSQTKQVTVNSGATATLNFALATGGKISGKVTNSSGVAIAGAAVNLTGGLVSTTLNVTTTSTGTYNSGWVPIGTYTVTVTASGYSTPQTATVNVTTGNTTTQNFVMK